ncbi:glycosyltransferase [Acidianus sp. RZ1]|uniref:glycosyltransferase n=1 Tax=Acidianus sp. RZ1 TaxID=1540082 RepID=UPI001491DE6B|nr:glycosyltransferase [Acidianus sp. RZ1]NON61714.1 glycosyltransferase [Acidianus sp. RZ1]
MLVEIGLLLAICLVSLHFIEPLWYYTYLSKRINLSVSKPDNSKQNVPFISVIIPTYNERESIKEKIKNVIENYPTDKMEIIIVDSSNDGTDKEIQEMAIPNLKLIKEAVRKGKIFALKKGLEATSHDIVVVTDADALWKDPITDAILFLVSNENVGGVTCIKYADRNVENSYRDFYNVIRMGESSLFSTPIFHGELEAFKKSLIDKDNIPIVGADDSALATILSIEGFRALSVPFIRAVEKAPKDLKDYFSWKTRRGSHLVKHFARFLPRVLKSRTNRRFKFVFVEEAFLHLINPWLLVIGIILLGISSLPIFIIAIGVSTLSLLFSRTRRIMEAWIPNQFFLILSQFKALKREVIVWKKEKK